MWIVLRFLPFYISASFQNQMLPIRPLVNFHGRGRSLLPKLMSSLTSVADRVPDLPSQDTITSTSNAYIKHIINLRSKTQYRSEVQRLVLVTSLLIREASQASSGQLDAIALFVSEDFNGKIPGLRAGRTFVVSEAVMKVCLGQE